MIDAKKAKDLTRQGNTKKRNAEAEKENKERQRKESRNERLGRELVELIEKTFDEKIETLTKEGESFASFNIGSGGWGGNFQMYCACQSHVVKSFAEKLRKKGFDVTVEYDSRQKSDPDMGFWDHKDGDFYVRW